MRTTLLAFAGLSLTMGLTAPALAQDDAKQSYDGVYVAASGGYDVQTNDLGSIIQFDRNGDGNFNEQVSTAAGANAFSPGFCNGRAIGATFAATCENDRNRPSYYGRVGYDRQYGPVVVGVVGEFGKTNIKDYVTGFSTTPASYTMERGVEWESSGRLRVGVTPGDGLFYATGGVGYARLNHRFATTNTANAFSTLLNDRDRFGFVVGGGAEVRIVQHFTLGLEYSYHDYKDGQYLVRVTQGSAPSTNPFVLAPYTSGTTIGRSDNNFRWHSLRAVVGYRF